MMTLKQFWLAKLAEECQEVAQRALKSMQFGATEIQTGQEKTNAQRLHDEIIDLETVIDWVRFLNETDFKSKAEIHEQVWKKEVAIYKYLKYSQELGMVERG